MILIDCSSICFSRWQPLICQHPVSVTCQLEWLFFVFFNEICLLSYSPTITLHSAVESFKKLVNWWSAWVQFHCCTRTSIRWYIGTKCHQKTMFHNGSSALVQYITLNDNVIHLPVWMKDAVFPPAIKANQLWWWKPNKSCGYR